MRITIPLLSVFASLISLPLPMLAQSTPTHVTVLVGTYTNKTNSKGIYAFDFDPSAGKLTPKGLATETPNPSWLVIHPNGKWVYAANESGKQSTVSAFSLDAKFAKLTLLNQLPSQGEDPCYLSFDKTGKYLFVANYTSGTMAVFPLLDDGKLGQPTSVLTDQGSLGPNKARQDGPHAHWASSNGYVADLGLDRVLFYNFDSSNGKLQLRDATVDPSRPFAQNSLVLAPGTGPRHVAIGMPHPPFYPIYVLGELDSTVTVFLNSKEGIYGSAQKISALPPGYSGRNDAAEITIHPNGKFLYTSNRGHDSIALFIIDPSNGKLSFVSTTPTGGKEPRHFALDPTGQFLLAENQHSNNIVIFRINPATGALTEVSRTENIPSPVCLVFLPAPAP